MTRPLTGDKFEIAVLNAELRGFSELIDTWKEEAERCARAIERVRELHKLNKYNECERCSENTCWGCQEWSDCLNCECPCHGTWPCDTIKALDGEQ